ncbi:MAG: S9 family peptidase, partial [Hyphomicrobiales bacterium]
MNDSSAPAPGAAAPKAEKRQHETTMHGIVRDDEYAWLRADNWQEVMRDPSALAADIRTHLEAENAYTAATLADTEKLQATLFDEMKGRIKEDDSSVPAPDGAHAYYIDFVTGGQHPRYCRCDRNGGNDQVLLDGDALAEGKDYFSLG